MENENHNNETNENNRNPQHDEGQDKQQDDIKKQIADLNEKLEALKKGQIPDNNSSEKMIEMLFEKGTPLVMGYLQFKNEAENAQAERDCELEKEEIKIINKLDTKEKFYKGIMLCFCLTALILCATLFDKAESIVPVLSLIIGLLFKSNSLADFFAHAKNKLGGGDE